VSPDRCVILSDAELALDAAFGLDATGVVLIAGTGSIAIARDPGGLLDRTGGWGPLLGDEGGGHAVGLRGLAAVADAFDGGPETMLSALAAERFHAPNAERLRLAVYSDRTHPASFAPTVLDAADASDPVACAILDGQVAAVAARLVWLVKRRGQASGLISYLGGLTNREAYLGRLRQHLERVLPEWRLAAPKTSPVDAALARAERLASALR
jgi:N-acetylglucosamine kinase-like BadF-type ATPase